MNPDPAYRRQWREANPEARAAERRRQQAYRRALLALAAAYPGPFRKIHNAERAAIGLPPVGAVKPGPKRKNAA